jgi:hypothetical protein
MRNNMSTTFRTLVGHVGLKPRDGSGPPRLHALRHSFAVSTLLAWYRDGENVAARMPLLSAYLGHAKPASTYWYLQAPPICSPRPPPGSTSLCEHEHEHAGLHHPGVFHPAADRTA